MGHIFTISKQDIQNLLTEEFHGPKTVPISSRPEAIVRLSGIDRSEADSFFYFPGGAFGWQNRIHQRQCVPYQCSVIEPKGCGITPRPFLFAVGAFLSYSNQSFDS